MSVTMDGIYVDGQKAKFRPEDILEGDASAYTEEIGESVTAWLDENVTSGETLVVDNTLTISGAAADAKVTGDEIGAVKEDLTDTNDALDYATAVSAVPITEKNKYFLISNNHIDVNNPQTSSTGYGYSITPCSMGDVFMVSGVSSGSQPMAWAFVDSEYTILSMASSNITVTDTRITAPPNSAYLVIHDKSPYRLSYKGVPITEKIDDIEYTLSAIVNRSLTFDNVGYVNSSGAINTSSSGRNTGFVKLGAETKVKAVTSISSAGYAIAFYDSSYTFMSSASVIGNGAGTYNATVPSGAVYVVVSAYSYPSATCLIWSETSIESRVEQLETEVKHYSTFSILGDSYSTFAGYMADENALTWFPSTADNDVTEVTQTWWYQFANSYGSRLIKNDSWSGSTISYDGYGTGTADGKDASFVERRGLLGDAELLLVFGGTNDAWVANDTGRADFLGEYKYSDFTEADMIYFRPACAYLLSQIQKEYVGAKIVFIINSDIGNVSPSIKAICEHYSIPYVQLNNISKTNAHPNSTGMTQICTQVKAFMEAF